MAGRAGFEPGLHQVLSGRQPDLGGERPEVRQAADRDQRPDSTARVVGWGLGGLHRPSLSDHAPAHSQGCGPAALRRARHDLRLGVREALFNRLVDPNRVLKIRAFRERLVVPPEADKLPRLVVASGCRHFLRTVPSRTMDEENPEDIDTEQEDPVYDEACHVVVARAYGHSTAEIKEKIEAKEKEETRSKLPKAHREVWGELDKIREQLEEQYQDF